RDRRSDDFGEIARRDGNLTEQPEYDVRTRGIVIPTRLREVAPGHDPELRGEALQKDRHEVREENDAEQCVAERRASGEIRRPIARIHVSDGDQIARSGERENLPPPSPLADRNGAIDLGEARGNARPTPPVFGRDGA